MKILPGRYSFREGRMHKRCVRCNEFWPLETAFWWWDRRGWHSWCRACCNESRRETRRRKRESATPAPAGKGGGT